MKPIEGYNKLRGGYYTPDKISEFITEWTIRTSSDSVLEPSCGDGSFLGAITKRYSKLGATHETIKKNVIGIELDDVEAAKSEQYGTTVIYNDFFTYYQENIDDKVQFDAIVGNPPFIRYQYFTEEYRKIAFALMNKHGFKPNRLTNIWLPFLVLSCKALKPNGRIGMVIPAELFQVDYAAEARQFLSNFFDKLTLVTFKRLVFADIQQEVILLLGERGCDKHGIRVVELDDMADLIAQGHTCLKKAEFKELDHGSDKWVKYYLSNEELSLLKRLNGDPRISDATDLFEVNVGLVSGENDFFVINQTTIEEFKLQESVIPIISRSEQLKGVRLTVQDYEGLTALGKRVFFFAPGNVNVDKLTDAQRTYIQWGEEKNYNKNYKCRIRAKWYYVSQSWRADAFLIRQAHLYPRMILNEKHALVTDTLHKVRFLDGVEGKSVVAAFLNTYTFALSETIGRSYGGGVLTFEPGEMRKIRIPMKFADQLDLQKIDTWQRLGEIDKILEYTDKILLRDGLGLSEHEVCLLHSIWDKMRNRRVIRKAQNVR
ncbi:MAG: class I SAM-dependent methyltransferase [Clostridiales bacterium]|nr:class I SAM-dependent methyltransferase [Clostridiales bacterium]